MAFKEMIEDLKAKGLLGDKNELTPKGHDYVEEIKRKYSTNIKVIDFTQVEKKARPEYVRWK